MPLKDPNPITYRMLHEDAAGMGLCPEFFTISNIDPEAAVTCNCNWDAGHEPNCDMVAVFELRRRRGAIRGGTNAAPES